MQWVAILFATSLVHVINVISSRSVQDPSSLVEVMRVAFILVPVSYFATLGYAVYFSQGTKVMDYAPLCMISIALNVVLGLVVSAVVFKQAVVSIPVLAGVLLCGFGIYLMVAYR